MLNKPSRRIAVAVLVALASATHVLAEQEELVERVYSIQYLGLEQARLLVEEQFPALLNADTRLKWEQLPRRQDKSDSPRGYLRLLASAEIHQGVAGVLKENDIPPRTLLFQVTLLEASKQPGERPELPREAAKAVDDLEGFLPFKSYSLIDSGMIRTSAWGRLQLSDEWLVELDFRGRRQTGMPLSMERFELVGLKIAAKVIMTSFSMNVGETVVVGTSKLNGGDEALVVLLTVTE